MSLSTIATEYFFLLIVQRDSIYKSSGNLILLFQWWTDGWLQMLVKVPSAGATNHAPTCPLSSSQGGQVVIQGRASSLWPLGLKHTVDAKGKMAGPDSLLAHQAGK